MYKTNYLRILRLAFPIMLANASVPLLGLADTAAIGQTGTAAELGAIALAALIFSFIYWGFGFLRMGTTGFVSQAIGARDTPEMMAVMMRAVLLGGGIGVGLMALQVPIGRGAIALLNASEEINMLVRQYFHIRIWGAPATLMTFAILGTLIGGGWTRQLLFVQLFLNGLNLVLNILFVVGFGWGVSGIAWGTVIAEWATLFFAGHVLLRRLPIARSGSVAPRIFSKAIWNRDKLSAFFRVNRDIMIRTLALLSGFAWFANQGASFGDTVLAANHILLQFVSLSAFFLDGYAHVVEMLTGQAYGARNKQMFDREVRDSSVLAAATALLLAVFIYGSSAYLIPLLTRDVEVQRLAQQHVLFAAIYIVTSFAAFQLDGVFIGVTRSREMRNATLGALIVFVCATWGLVPTYANAGLWIGFILFVVVRALTLLYYYPRINAH